MERERERESSLSSSYFQFKTKDGSEWTGLGGHLDDEPVVIKERFDDRPLSMFPKKNMRFAQTFFKATAGGWTVPNQVNYKNECGNSTDQGIGSCYMHASINWAKWLTWIHTSIKYSPSNDTIDYVYAGGKSGGYEDDLSRVWNISGDDFISKFKQVCGDCNITSDTFKHSNHESSQGKGSVAKENAIKMLNQYGPLFYVHDCGLYRNPGYHAILLIGYDANKVYFMNSWASTPWPVVTWDRFTSFDHSSAGSRGVYLAAIGSGSGTNVWKNL